MATAYLFDPIFMRHRTGPGHPEKPERCAAINDAIVAAPYYRDLVKITPSLPEMKYLELVHAKSYIQRVREEIQGGTSYLDSMDTAVCRESYDVALNAVGGCLNMCDAIMAGKAVNGFCSVRPPGHHAEWDSAAGFCIFNNIAVAARYLESKYDIKRIAIVDWDVHHGNGTQHTFELDHSILYISLHQYPHYPGSGAESEKGSGTGKGYTLNIPMREGSGDEDYLQAFQKLIIPTMERFTPDIVLISAGFDAHRDDPLSSIRLSTGAFAEFTRMLMRVAGACSQDRIIAFLEGGYNLRSLADSARGMMDVFVNG
jgi:acetoin utilization deacetylase AcuC-like enzyme